MDSSEFRNEEKMVESHLVREPAQGQPWVALGRTTIHVPGIWTCNDFDFNPTPQARPAESPSRWAHVLETFDGNATGDKTTANLSSVEPPPAQP